MHLNITFSCVFYRGGNFLCSSKHLHKSLENSAWCMYFQSGSIYPYGNCANSSIQFTPPKYKNINCRSENDCLVLLFILILVQKTKNTKYKCALLCSQYFAKCVTGSFWTKPLRENSSAELNEIQLLVPWLCWSIVHLLPTSVISW